MTGARIQPRMLSKEQAAAYCGMSVAAFARNCPLRPSALGDDARLYRYDIKLLDVWLDGFGSVGAASSDDLWIAKAEKELADGVE